MKIFLAVIFILLYPLSSFSQEDHLIILSPHWEGVRYEFQWAFQEAHKRSTGRDVSFTWLDAGGTSEILRFIRSEYDKNPGGINIDLFFGGGIEPYEELKRQNLLSSYKVPDMLLNRIPKDIGGTLLVDPDYQYYSPVIGSFGILCNAEVLKIIQAPLPKTWEDLTQPLFHSWLASSDPRKSGSSHMIYEIILQAYGWEKGWDVIFGLGQNIRSFGAQSNQPAKDVESGEVACAFAYDTQAWWAQQKYGADAMPLVLPEGLTALAPDAAGILRGAPNKTIAEHFMDFLMSDEGQRLWIKPKGSIGGPKQYNLARMPVIPSIYKESGPKLTNFNPFQWQNSFVFESDKASRRWNILNDLLGVFIIDYHELLRSKDVGIRFPSIPTEEIVLSYSKSWSDPRFRDSKIQEWKKQNKELYGKRSYKSLFILSLPGLFILILIGRSWMLKR